MKIKWEHTKIGAAASRSGVTKLFKLDTLEENDIDLPGICVVYILWMAPVHILCW